MNHFSVEQLAKHELIKGFSGRFVHSECQTIAYWDVEAGCELPEHSHHHQQILNMISGQFELTVNEETRVLNAGDVVVIDRNCSHAGKALTDCQIIDVFEPARDDYRL